MRPISSIAVYPEVQDGAPVFRGTNVRVETFYDYLRIGVSVQEFLREYPSITSEQAYEALALAKDNYTVEQIASLLTGPKGNYLPPSPVGRVYSQPVPMR